MRPSGRMFETLALECVSEFEMRLQNRATLFLQEQDHVSSIHPTKSWLDQVVVEKKEEGEKKIATKITNEKRENIAIASKSINYPMEEKKI